MSSGFFGRSTVRILFVAGLLCICLGAGFLFASMEGTNALPVFVSFLFLVAGCVFAVAAIKLNKRAVYLFLASFLLMTGFFLFLQALKISPWAFSQAWPLLAVFSGLSLFPAGWRRFGRPHAAFIVPSAAFVILGCVLLFFSFDVVPFSFRQFIVHWWPFLFALAGLLLLLLSFVTRRAPTGQPNNDKEDTSGA
ncbi:MAG: hypothetical protein LBR16_03740 [Treponema sp.]|jgi:hypothetical protein|nr:hypothetical protein [Treponema sp.]